STAALPSVVLGISSHIIVPVARGCGGPAHTAARLGGAATLGWPSANENLDNRVLLIPEATLRTGPFAKLRLCYAEPVVVASHDVIRSSGRARLGAVGSLYSGSTQHASAQSTPTVIVRPSSNSATKSTIAALRRSHSARWRAVSAMCSGKSPVVIARPRGGGE